MRIAIVNDMPLAVEALRRALALEPEHRIAWIAGNGAEAVQNCQVDLPDLVLMDLLMPVMDGVEATRLIMAHTPCAILIVSVDIEQHISRVFEAMGHGALDAVNTPSLGTDKSADATALLRKIQNIGWLIGQHSNRKRSASVPTPGTAARRLVAIGASAGGPAALAALLKQLPGNFNAAVMLVQHVDEVFAAGMADWLAGESAMPVRLARAGEQPQPGVVLLAGTNNHMRLLRNGELDYTEEPRSHVYRPSIDVFFDSVAEHWRGEAIGVLLTGMGRDGAQGLKNLRGHGFTTIAQSQASCAVYGMPKAAAELDAAKEILALERIAPRIVELFG
ncbi:chemotaxis response regulator protein-glutamate methylesterase [Pseudomonas seleniipraecipitans]|uniref:Protein-glutamate methylesterase/protein-glutamine glutaminase n=1 Tax=Phytopseudomonas seleniipraecipitans TaxID=640205 RepID=A0A1G7GN26_9GAMM|nr:chemotaxis response regulator protein-glutamate methylesterase [Pseudomonas seleniipraecipitans]NQD81393.1 chemotaxis response regulator protein-glutamate methylesterase [Pseudomonas sp. CrR14]UUD63399.1 chemotaxis response regulator protein-glutamate methylesterase [Pseudomonas seleniipraecipitans]SDE89578.1 two-component system, chemotaxis family, response regulator WspF [Pseudomonas seleniipraecipitans]